MPLIRISPPWQLPEKRVTPEADYLRRRRFLKQMIGTGLGIGTATLPLWQQPYSWGETSSDPAIAPIFTDAPTHSDFQQVDRPVTLEEIATTYNNFYEFGYPKDIWKKAQVLPTDPWQVTVSGLVKQPRTYDLDDLRQRFPLEERIYRFRCVEAWAMVVPWIGFPMRLLMDDVDPLPQARYVRFTSFYDREIAPGPLWPPSLPWPYVEGLRLDEMANELAFFALGMYDKPLPKQNGAPIRMVIPWKYGFKGAKSVVSIEFVAEQPATFWNTVSPHLYGFESNVNPAVPHRRWSQETETLVGSGPESEWERYPTLLYNGYGEYVADLYS